jgi:hypothetical protein
MGWLPGVPHSARRLPAMKSASETKTAVPARPGRCFPVAGRPILVVCGGADGEAVCDDSGCPAKLPPRASFGIPRAESVTISLRRVKLLLNYHKCGLNAAAAAITHRFSVLVSPRF